ncbi:MAG: TolC family protein [Candidatus Omnitrophota bacterium]
MKNIFIGLTVLLFSAGSSFAEGIVSVADKPLTLPDCYALALKQSEIIAIDAERIKEAEGHFLQALGTLLPHVTFSSDIYRGEPVTSTNKGSIQKFTVKQLLFQGFKEFAAMRGGSSEKDQRTNETIRAKQLLFTDVSDAFYLLMEVREDLKSLHTIERALKDRLKELNEREKLGRSRKSEVVNTEAQLFGVVADIEFVKSRDVLVRQLLEFLVGRPVREIIDNEAVPPFMRPESDYISKAAVRPDVVAAKNAWDVYRNGVIVARSGFFPTVSLESNYYAKRTISPTNTEWDAKLNITVPIFQGTETFGVVKSAVSQARQAELTASRTLRLAVQDIRDSYVRFESALLIYNALKRALSAAEMNYSLQKEDYKFNLVNNIDVLDAIQKWQTSKRNYIHSLYEAKRAYWRLLVATGSQNVAF